MFLRQICFSMVVLLYHRSGSQQVRDYFGEDMLLIALPSSRNIAKSHSLTWWTPGSRRMLQHHVAM